MTEYISRDEVMQKFLNRGDGYITMLTMRDMINEIPAADVQPVIHSRWIPTGDGTYNAYCENCGQERYSQSWNKNDFTYCFGCGARMEQEG